MKGRDMQQKCSDSRAYNRARRERFRSMGLCYHCGKVPAVGDGRGKCQPCMDKQNEARSGPLAKAAAARRSKMWREKKKRLGLCAKCNEPAISGKTLCEEHHRRTWQRNNAKKIVEGVVSVVDYVPPVVVAGVTAKSEVPWWHTFEVGYGFVFSEDVT